MLSPGACFILKSLVALLPLRVLPLISVTDEPGKSLDSRSSNFSTCFNGFVERIYVRTKALRGNDQAHRQNTAYTTLHPQI